MSNLRVLIVYSQLLLARAIEDALRGQEGLEVITIDGAQSDANLQVKSLCPDVVVLDRHEADHSGTVPEVCRDNPGTKVIIIDHGSNDVCVFRVFYEKVRADEPRDLIPLICSSH
ncbi:MAG: hypothetical protein HY675_10460 [Chloroflexi bacterium]|nr:hypothetical protein [Chloroflexota bacterium]